MHREVKRQLIEIFTYCFLGTILVNMNLQLLLMITLSIWSLGQYKWTIIIINAQPEECSDAQWRLSEIASEDKFVKGQRGTCKC